MKLFVIGLMTLISLSTWAQQGDVILEKGQTLNIQSLKRIDIPFNATRISFDYITIDLVSASRKNRFIPEGTRYEVTLDHDAYFDDKRLNNLIPDSSVIKRLIATNVREKRPRLSALIECINRSGVFQVENTDLIDTAPEEVR